MRPRVIGIGLPLLATLVATACDESDSVVVVKVTADTGLPSVFQLRASVSNAGAGVTRLFPAAPSAEPIAFDTAFSLTVPRSRTGALDIALDGLDGDGAVVANGTETVDLHVGDNVTVTIALRAGASLCGNGRVDADEGCDDGDRLSSGGCDFVCQPRPSGPGTGGMGGDGGTGGGGAGAGGSIGAGEAGAGVAGTGVAGTGVAGTGGAGMAGTGAGGRGGTGGQPCMIELLTSGGFDGDNSRWTQVTSGRMLIYSNQTPTLPSFVPAPQTAPRLAWLGYDVLSADPALRQNITIPAGTVQVNISGHYQIQTDESGCACDYAWVELDVGGNITKLTEWSAQNANTNWAYFATFVNGAPIAGRTIAFQLHAKMDDGVNTSFFFDSLSVTADVCP